MTPADLPRRRPCTRQRPARVFTTQTSDVRWCRREGCPYLTRLPSGLCPGHEEDA